MCESLRPGMTVRRRPSITRVWEPRRRRISSSFPTAATFPAVMAIASTNEGTPFVAILALCKMSSADTAVSVSGFSKWIEKGGGGSALQVLLVSCEGGWNYIFGKLRCRQTMDHGVSVFDPNTIGSEMRSHDVHDCVVGSLLSPIALPFEHDLHRGDRLCAGLNDALHRIVVSKLAHIAAAIFHDIDFVAVMNRLHRGKRNTDFRPKAGNENLLAAGFLDRRDEVLVIPGVHRGSLDRLLAGNTARNCGHIFPLKDFVSTVVKTTGTSNTLAAFPIATVLLMIPWRSKLLVPNSIWP